MADNIIDDGEDDEIPIEILEHYADTYVDDYVERQDFKKQFAEYGKGLDIKELHYLYCFFTENALFGDLMFETMGYLDKDGIEAYSDIIDNYKKKLAEMQTIFEKYTNTQKGEYEKYTEAIEDTRDKKTLEKLIIDCLIQPSENPKKYNPVRKSTKQICKYLLWHGYNEAWTYVFMNKYINYDVETSSILNYIRELKKDMPLKQTYKSV